MKQVYSITKLFDFYPFQLFVKKLFIILSLFFTPLLLTAATTSLTNSTSSTIADNSCFDKTFNLSLPASSINNVTISVDVIHTYRGDLELYLTSPSATTVQLTIKNGSNGADNLIVLFDDTASTSITSDLNTHTTLVNRTPANPLNIFNGESPQGIWTLQICDRYNGDNGTFNSSTLNVDYALLNTPPTANAGADQNIPFGTAVTLDASGSSDSDGTISSYLWQEGTTTLSNLASFTKSDFTVGTHTLTLTVTDNDGATATDTIVITVVGNFPPLANAGADQIINLGDMLTLDGTGSSDPDGNITAYAWDEGGIAIGSTPSITLNSVTAGTHIYKLTVTDNYGDSSSDTVVVRVNTAPIANAGIDQNITLGDSLTLDGTASIDDFSNIISYVWSEGTIPLALNGDITTVNIATAGTYTITLTVTDDNGLTDTDTITVRVNTPPVVEDMNFTILQNTPISFELNATDDDNDTIVSYPIILAPVHGSLSGPESNITYTPDVNYTGVDIFTYKAYDGIDYSNTGTVTINIYPPATAIHDDFNTTYNTLLNGNVLTNDLGLNLTLIDFNTTANGSLSISSDGEFTYIPNVLFDGNDTFSYTIKDDFNITSTATVTILVYPPRSDLSIIKTAPSQTDIGLPIDYTLEIHNAIGEQYINAKNVRVTDALPSGATYSGITAPSGWTCGYVGGVVTCDASDIPLGYNGTIVIHAFAPPVLGNSINTATISSDTIDPDLSNNTSSATTNITGPDVDLSISKTVSSSTVTVTNSFTYTLNIQNNGTADATGVTVTDNLDSSLGFISIDAGTDWVCSQGSTINCSYIANGGVFVAGGSSNAITINVRAPSVETNITNTASVSSSIPEINTSNNSDNVDISIINGTNQTSGVALSKYLQYNLYGDIKLIGNANLNKLPGDPDQSYNDLIDMHYVDTDSIETTYNSSSSTLTLNNPKHNIIWAGLYWEGHICSTSTDGTGDGSNTGCDWSDSPYSNFNQASSTTNLGSIRLKTPHRSSYINVTANTVNIIQSSNTDWTYSAFTDITNLLDSNETGTYSVADIVLTEGQKGSGGNYGGWAILFIYEDSDTNKTLSYKNISVFNGFQYINSDNNNLNISGFLTPLSGDINASIAFFAADGDPANGGVARMLDANDNTFKAIGSNLNYDAPSPVTNLFNSTISEFGRAINSGITTTYGVDADRIDVSNFMTNSQTNAQFRLDVSNPFGSGVDYYSISLFAFATDLTSPLIDGFSKSAIIIDADGSTRPAGPNQPIYPGSSLQYNIFFENIGDETAEDVVIFDDFDFDGLSQALNIDYFDTTKLKLFNGNSTNAVNEVANPDCGYDLSDRRVYCNLPTVAINQSFTMQFVVDVKENLNISLFDTNASNTAYAQYRNPNGNSYVEFYTTPSGEPVGGKSNALNSGVFSAINRGNEDYISVDAINKGYDYNLDKNITTKIVNKPFDIKLILRDKYLNNIAYQAWQNSKPMTVLVTLEGNGIPTPPLGVGTFYQGMFNTTLGGLILNRAHRNDRFKMAYLDWKTILSWAPSTSACVVNTNQSVNLNGLPECFNSYTYVKDIFPPDSFPQIATCYGKDTPIGKDYPCNPLAYRTGGDLISTNIYPEVYNHNYGCYQCITQGYLHFRNDSTDDFSARPDKFDFSSTNPSFPDLLRSGQEYNLSLVAKDGIDNPTLDYNTTGNTFASLPPTFNPNNDPSVTASLEGNVTISPSSSTIRNGITVDTNGNPIDGIGFTFNNVGEIGINLIDDAWANVDEDDTPEDCNTTTNAYGIIIEGGRGICGSIITRFIPHHFQVTSVLNNHKNGSFTYMSTNDYSNSTEPLMSARVALTIMAKNKQNDTTTNFKENAYESPISVDLNITDWNASAIAAKPNPRLDINLNYKEISTPTLLGFGTNGYSNGTYTIESNSSTPFSKRLLFNYDHIINTPSNPFFIHGSEVNSTVTSIYTTNANAPEGSANIKGTDIADGNATFYYARVRPAEYFYPNVTTNQKRTPVLIDVYCDISADMNFSRCNRQEIDIDTTLGNFRKNDLKWWLALKHDQSQNDGNITLKVTGTGGLNKTSVIINPGSNAKDNNIIVTPGTADRPTIVTIDLDTTNPTDTNTWLIYNPNDSFNTPSPFEQVQFIGTSTSSTNWTGHGETGNVVDSNANRKINKRLGW